MIPEIGDTVSFIPSAYILQDTNSEQARKQNIKNTVTGKVTMIHWRHAWYRATYRTDYNGIQHECFKFYP